MTVQLQVNGVAVASAWFREQAEVQALVGDRIVSTWAKNQQFPAARLTRIGGQLVQPHTQVAERQLLQVTVLGGGQKITWQIAETLRGLLLDRTRFRGRVTLDGFDPFAVTHVHPGGIREGSDETRLGDDGSVDADEARPAAKPQASFDALITFRPL